MRVLISLHPVERQGNLPPAMWPDFPFFTRQVGKKCIWVSNSTYP